jgi:hypothetical protein
LTLILNAILERAANPSKRDVYVFVDEASEYFSNDNAVETFLKETRKHKAGLIIANQDLDQMPQKLRAGAAANTAIKFAGGVSYADAQFLHRDMRTTTDFIMSQPELSFAAYVRGQSGAISLSFPPKYMEQMEQLTPDEYAEMRAENRRKYCISSKATSGYEQPEREHPGTTEDKELDDDDDPDNPDIGPSSKS